METFFYTEAFHALRVKSFRDKNSFRAKAPVRAAGHRTNRASGTAPAVTRSASATRSANNARPMPAARVPRRRHAEAALSAGVTAQVGGVAWARWS
jgi:hypothetical protein